jgi:signal transduction histidine kinase
MGEPTPDRSSHTILNRRTEQSARERSGPDEWLGEERSITDESLREERSVTDDLLDPRRDEQRVVEVVRESRTDAVRALREVRADSDVRLEKRADGLPEMSEKLERVAENLSEAAASLTGVAAVLQESSGDPVTNIAQIAQDLKGTAESADASTPGRVPADVPGTVTVQLAEIAEGIAEITSTLSEERRDADQILREERNATDQLIVQELKEVEATLAQELRKERVTLWRERQATDEDLANERRQTDEAVEHVQDLLVEERRHHSHAARGVATRNEFLGIVSHDLRGPLMTISGVAALMDQQAPADETGQRMHVWADRVRRSVSVMERLISDLLDVNSFEDGRLRIVAERLDIRALIRGAIDASHGVALAKGVSLEADLPDDPIMTKHDPHRMFQVLSNLIHNAIKFTPEGGSIRIRAARAGRFCEVSVSDTGVGIPGGELTGIFERFRQLNPSARTGLGLGLYISKWIVEAHGGRIWAESTVGIGTTVHFTLPEERRSDCRTNAG